MMKLSKRILPWLLSVICTVMLLPMPVSAAGAIDTEKDVTLTIQYAHNKVPVCGVQLDLYRVADVDAYAEFTLTGDFKQYPVSVSGLTSETWKALAETLAGYVSRDALAPLESGKTDGEGKLVFPGKGNSLKPGLYLVIGRQMVQDDYTYTTEPFLVSLPDLDSESNAWQYDVTAVPKHTRTQNPPSTPDNPPSPDNPSTPPEDTAKSVSKTVTRKVLKIWKDDDPQLRPREVVIELLQNGTVYDTVTLNAANDWRYTWEKLPEYGKDGSRNDWNVVEKETENYTVLACREGITFTVTNTYVPAKEAAGASRPTGTADVQGQQRLPQTGVLWWPVPVLACGGVAFLIAGALGRKKDDNKDKDHE